MQAWRERHPDFLDTGRAAFQAHDFFKPQPPLPENLDVERKESVNGNEEATPKPVVPSVFILRVVTHDWPDSYVIKYVGLSNWFDLDANFQSILPGSCFVSARLLDPIHVCYLRIMCYRSHA